MRRYLLCLLPFLLTISAFAQADNCPTLERVALSLTQTQCFDLAFNTACYGSPDLEIEPRASDAELSFSVPGERVNLSEVMTITSAILPDAYGIAPMQTLAYAADTWAAHRLSLVVLGDVMLRNTAPDVGPTLTVAVEAEQGLNVRRNPQLDSTVVAALLRGEQLQITGRLANSEWVRVQLRNGRVGWASSLALNLTANDIASIRDVTPETNDTLQLFQPFAAFELSTGSLDARCAEGWESGVLLQTSANTLVEIRINGQMLFFDGTLFLQGQPDDVLSLLVLEGELNFAEQTVAESNQVVIFADETIAPRSAAYDFERVTVLPFELLPRPFYLGVDLTTIITPAPQIDRSPIIDTLVTAPCVITTGRTGANLRGGPSTEFPIRGVLAFRETANPTGRASDRNGINWWQLAPNIWISSETTVTGGDCVAVPQADVPELLPTATVAP